MLILLIISSGTNPYVRDECGRTPLDLALIMLEDLIVTSLCTSFPVDFLVKTLEYDSKFPAKFVPRYAKFYENMYDHPNALRLANSTRGGISAANLPGFGTGSPSEYPRFIPTPFPAYKHDALPTHVYDKMVSPAVDAHPPVQRRKLKKPQKEGSGDESDDQSDKSSEESEESEESGESGEFAGGPFRPPGASKLQKLFQDQMIVVVEDAIQQPTPSRVKKRMHELLSQMRALIRSINLLITCEPLRVMAVEYRSTISSKSGDRPPKFILEYLTFPYLFMATLQVFIIFIIGLFILLSPAFRTYSKCTHIVPQKHHGT